MILCRFAEIQVQGVRFYPGYRSARFLVSTDGTRVYDIVHWAGQVDYRASVETSDTEGRMLVNFAFIGLLLVKPDRASERPAIDAIDALALRAIPPIAAPQEPDRVPGRRVPSLQRACHDVELWLRGRLWRQTPSACA